MDVVKLTDPRETALEHLDIGQRGDGVDVVGRHARHEAVHECAPAPEVVGRGAAELGEARHAALEAVTVHVADAGQCGRRMFVAGLVLSTPAQAANRVTPGHFTGYGFDQCVTPSQEAMEQLVRECFVTDQDIVTPELVRQRYELSARPGAHEAMRMASRIFWIFSNEPLPPLGSRSPLPPMAARRSKWLPSSGRP